ncbi:MAG: hypothetical protein DMF61_09850 [Blastocatellia bacterium AA13]|nr:MAG: hypothetical protein DMF61_09850 [Blastocatellia bacterium AA13]
MADRRGASEQLESGYHTVTQVSLGSLAEGEPTLSRYADGYSSVSRVIADSSARVIAGFIARYNLLADCLLGYTHGAEI